MVEPESRVHPAAEVHPTARIGEGTFIGPFAVIEPDVEIGRDCQIHAHAVVKQFTILGDENQVWEGAVLGGLPQDLKHEGGRSGLVIGDRNIFRENVTVNRATSSDSLTRVGHGNFFMTGAHVAHDCVVEDHVVMANCVALAGHVLVETYAFLSGGVVVHQFSRVGRHSMIGGNAKVTQDVLPFFLVDGVPARIRSLNLVGLRRAGFGRADMQALKEAYRSLADLRLALTERVDALAGSESEPVRYLVDFIRQSSRGFCGFASRET